MDLRLYLPQYNDLEFRRQLLSDPDTMSFNRGKDPAPDYNPKTGCIDFARGTWALWYGFWMEREPENFYAILADGTTPVGEVSWFFDGEHYNAGIIVKNEFRRKGYCTPALRLLCARAFEENHLPALRITCGSPAPRQALPQTGVFPPQASAVFTREADKRNTNSRNQNILPQKESKK